MTDGNWRLGVFVDERASDDQLDKLVKVFGGQLGGPMAGLAQMMGFGGGMPSPEEMAKLAEKTPGGVAGGLPPGMPGAPGMPPGGMDGMDY